MDELGFKMDDPNFLAGVFYTINFISKRQDLELNPMEVKILSEKISIFGQFF